MVATTLARFDTMQDVIDWLMQAHGIRTSRISAATVLKSRHLCGVW
jgi:hypothetical protein